MKRSHLIDIPPISHDAEFIRQVAFHEAGHAAAIHIRNKQQQLPPIYFQIYINHAYKGNECIYSAYENANAYLTKIEDGRLIHTLPSSVAKAVKAVRRIICRVDSPIGNQPYKGWLSSALCDDWRFVVAKPPYTILLI